MSSLYFQYKVVTVIQMRIPERVTTEIVNMCTRYTDILDYDRLNRESGRNWSYQPNDDGIKWKYQHELKVSEVYRYTPDVNQVMDRLIYRVNDTYDRLILDGLQVHQVMEVSKYLMLEQVCYRFEKRQPFTAAYDFFTVSPIGPGMLFEIWFNQSNLINRCNYLKIMIQRPSPWVRHRVRSLSHIPYIYRNLDPLTNKSHSNRYRVFKQRISVSLRPAPYESDCLDYHSLGYDSDAECESECMRAKTLSAWNKLPFSVIINDSKSDQNIISYHDLLDKEFTRNLTRMQQECSHRICRWKACHFGISFTNSDISASDWFVIRLTVPYLPWIYLEALPALDFIQFFTYVLGMLATYTGAGVLSCNPGQFRRWIGKRWRRRVPRSQKSLQENLAVFHAVSLKKTVEEIQ